MKRKSNQEIRDKAVELYNENKSAREISDILGFNEATIRVWLKKANVEIRNGGFYNIKYNEEVLLKIKELYSNGLYSNQIDDLLGLRIGTSQYLLNKNNINMRHRGPKSKINNEDFFECIDSEEKAYFLGFIVADGNISITNNQYCLKLHIAYKDREVIDKFLVCIGSSNKTSIKEFNNTKSYYVSLTSVKMCKRLIELGVIPRKTGKESIPEDLDVKYLRHFLRGFFDGDGITDVSKRRSGFVGSANMIDDILEILNENLTTYYSGKNKKVKYFLGGIKFSQKLYSYLYKDSTVFLERKKDRLRYIALNDGTPYEVKVSRTV